MALLLLQQGADITIKDNDGLTALHRAAKEGNEAVVGVLLEMKADIYAETRSRQTALHLAVLSRHAAVVNMLVANGA
jgi:uncharacterized protein